MDHRELLTNFFLFTDATANDVCALEAIGEPIFFVVFYRKKVGCKGGPQRVNQQSLLWPCLQRGHQGGTLKG